MTASRSFAQHLPGSVAAMESLADVLDLAATASAADEWSVEEAQRILAPLRTRAPIDWPCDSQRLELWDRRVFDRDACSDASLLAFLDSDLEEYKARYATPAAGCLRMQDTCVSLDEVYSVIKPLLPLPSAEWTDELGTP